MPVIDSRVVRGGYTPAVRLVVTFSSGSTLFAKIATNNLTAGWLRQEKHVYDLLTAPFMPSRYGWDDDAEYPILLLEDLSYAFWPPPWTASRIEQVIETTTQVAGRSIAGLPRLADHSGLADGWQYVAADPRPFLSLGLASQTWLNMSLPTLLAIDSNSVLGGDELLHLDLRSDNICFDGQRTVLIDWSLACVGNARFEIGAWLPSLEAEGGPPPESLLPDSGEIAGILSGYFASMAGRPMIPDAPHVRLAQLCQLKRALPWAVRTLDLPPLDGEVTTD